MLQHGAAAGSGTVGGGWGWLGSGPRVGEQQERECDDGEPRSSLNSPQVEPLHRRVFCTVRVERGGRDPLAPSRAPLPAGHAQGCVQVG